MIITPLGMSGFDTLKNSNRFRLIPFGMPGFDTMKHSNRFRLIPLGILIVNIIFANTSSIGE